MKRLALFFAAVAAMPAPARADPPPSPMASPQSAKMNVGGLTPDGVPTVSTAVAPGGEILSLPMTYAFTGRLREDIKPRRCALCATSTLFYGRVGSFPAGTPVFGLSMKGAELFKVKEQRVWCAALPTSESEGTHAQWSVTCFPQYMGYYTSIKVKGDVFPQRLSPTEGNQIEPPVVDEGSVALHPPIRLLIQFTGWNGNYANLRIVIRQSPDEHDLLGFPSHQDLTLGNVKATLDAGGAAHLFLFGGGVALTPAPDRRSAAVTIVKPFRQGL